MSTATSGTLGTSVPYSDKVKILTEHVKTVLTLSSASLPVIVALLGMLVGKDAASGERLHSFLRSDGWAIEVSLAFFLVAIIAGVVYNYLLCKDVNRPNAYARRLNDASILMHGAFLLGVGSFFWFGYRMVHSLR